MAVCTELPGRFTLRGTKAVEERIGDMVCGVAEEVARVCAPSEYRSLVMLGGYGRGEGGVCRTESGEFPHNNLDFLLITEGLDPAKTENRRDEIEVGLERLRHEYGVGIDFSTVSAGKLRRSPSLVIWYDMRFGHKTLLGDPAFVPSLERFQIDRIPAWDARNLLVNRGTLLVINDLLLEEGRDDPETRQFIVKHTVKAVIGYGDALLFSLGDYHWSYAEKQRRMQINDSVPEAFRQLYHKAAEFRFEPDYGRFDHENLGDLLDEVRPQLKEIHLHCESVRLKCRQLTWENYLETALRSAVLEDVASPIATIKKLKNLFSKSRPRLGQKFSTRAGAAVLGPRGVLPLLYPAAVYSPFSAEFRNVAAEALGASNNSLPALRRAYLKAWGCHGDINFPRLVRQLGLSLDSKESTS
jgi:hypothetical protein